MPDNTTTTEHTVKAVEFVDEDLFILTLERNGVPFMPGDCVALHANSTASRPYSIASGNQEDTLRFLIRKMEGGKISPWLMSRRTGDTVRASAPFGWFRPGQNIGTAPFVFIATGTGIAPFLSYRHSLPDGPPRAILYGVQKETHALGLESFKDWGKVQLAVSREQTLDHHHGRVTELLKNLSIDSETHYYLCGREGMIADVTQQLQDRGVDLFNIHREVFFHE